MDLIRQKNRARGHHLAQFGGGGSSSSSSSTTNNTDNRRTIAAGGISNEGGTVNVLDGGAIKNAFDFSGATVQSSLAFAAKSQAAALQSLDSQTQLVANAYNDAKGRGAMTDWILLAAIAMAGFVAFHNKG